MNADAGPTDAEADRLAAVDWAAATAELDAQGWAILPNLLSADECDRVARLYDESDGFRSRIVMARHGFGRGEYKYFAYPLPPLVEDLRTRLYERLAPIANRWHEHMGMAARFPADHAAFLARCHAASQTRPTPLLLRYGPGDYNCLHQDLYGEHVFPLQLAILLSEPGEDFEGGELVLTEQRPRMQSRAMVVPLRKGDAVLFAVNSRPVQGARGAYRVSCVMASARCARATATRSGSSFTTPPDPEASRRRRSPAITVIGQAMIRRMGLAERGAFPHRGGRQAYPEE